jgi:hypothetical protein
MLVGSAPGAVAVAAQAVGQSGAYEPVLTGLAPAIYLKFDETAGTSFSDSSGNGRSGILMGTGATLGAAALAPNVGASNKAVNLGTAAWIAVAHAAADVALTTSYASPWDGDHSGNRFIADVTISIWAQPNSLPTGNDKHVIISKTHTATPGTSESFSETHPMAATPPTTVSGGGWEAYIDADGAVHVEVRSFRGRYARVRTPNGAVSAGVKFHLAVQLSYDGVTAWLNGAKFEDGYANLLHVFGLAADIRRIVFRNDYDWMIGRAAWGGQADLIVDEFAVYLSTLDQSDAEALAQVGSTAPLEHFIWGQRYVDNGSYANIQAAIDDVHASGGGTVLINSGTYNESVQWRSNVRLKRNGTGTVTLTGLVSTAKPNVQSLGRGSGDFLIGDRTITLSNSRSVGDILKVRGLTNGAGGAATPMRHDRRWNNLYGESHDPHISDADTFLIEGCTGSDITVEGHGSTYDYARGNREDIQAFTPTSWVAIEDVTIDRSYAGTTDCIRLNYVVHGRLVNITSRADNGHAIEIGRNSIYVTYRNFTSSNNAIQPKHPTGIKISTGAGDIVGKDMTDHSRGHAVDVGGNANWGPTNRAEFHNLASIIGPTLAGGRYGTHGSSTDCLYWNIDCNYGGYDVTGWKHDTRWTRQGLNGGGKGNLYSNDGMGDCCYRDGWHVAPKHWFGGEQRPTSGCDRCYFENIHHSAPPTGTLGHEVHGLKFGTGADANASIDVDSPPPG